MQVGSGSIKEGGQEEVLTQGGTGWHRVAQGGTGWHTGGIRTILKGEAAESILRSRVSH
jgi:hypothetical protein